MNSKLITLSAILVSLFLFTSHLPAQNLVSNGDFENGFTGWTNLAGDGSSATYSLETTDPYEGINAMKVVITTLGTNSWSVQSLGPTLALTTGENYILTFYGKTAVAGTTARVVIQTDNWYAQDFDLTTEWTQYTHTFTAAEDTPQLKMHHFETGTLYIDDISIVPVVPVIIVEPIVLTLDPSIRHQTMDGFGGALTWYSDNIVKNHQNEIVMDWIVDDLDLDIIRLKSWYYPVDYPAVKSVSNLSSSHQANFNANKYFYDTLKAANPNIKILLSSWSPPAILKDPQTFKNGGTLAKNNEGYYRYEDFAQYWVDVLDHMEWAPDYLSFQNEPNYVDTWETAEWSPTETENLAGYAEALDAIYNRIKDRPDAPILIGPESPNLTVFPEQTTPLITKDYLGIFAYHLYNIGGPGQIDGINSGYHEIKGQFNDRPNWMTEYSNGNMNWLEAARVVHNTVVEANASAYIYWLLAWDADTTGNMIGISYSSAPTIEDYYYTIKHYSKYISEGYQRIESASAYDKIRISAFLNPGGNALTLVLLNIDEQEREIDLEVDNLSINSTAAYQTTMTLIDSNPFQSLGSIDLAQPQILPAESITTYVITLSESINTLDQDRFYLFDPQFSGGSFSVKIPAQNGFQFTLQKTADLANPSWQNVADTVQSEADGVLTLTDNSPGAEKQFYRVLAE